MKLAESFAIALGSLSANKLRSSLTMLGIIIGVGAVIALMSVGRGVQEAVTSTLEQIGSNTIFIIPYNPDAPGLAGLSTMGTEPTLTMDDAEALVDIPSVAAVAPASENYAEITANGESVATIVAGITPAYQEILYYPIASGQFISDRNVASRDMVVVLGSEVAENLFGSSDPIRQKVKIEGKRLTVTGVLEPKGGQMMGISMDNIVLLPITTSQSKLFTQRTTTGQDAVQSISIKVASSEAIDEVTAQAETILRKNHRLSESEDRDFAIVSQESIVGVLSQVTGIFTLFLGAIAGISLLVGGIGIMNIMLVSVTERTREIGIRKAVGAKQRDILLQFLLEAAMLSLIGGIIGIIGGWFSSSLVSQINVDGQVIQSVVSLDIVILAISVSVIIGLVSGIYPALRAAKLNPIDALHYG